MIEQIIENLRQTYETSPVGLVTSLVSTVLLGTGLVGTGWIAYSFHKNPPKHSEYENAIDRIYEVAGSLTDENKEGLKEFVEDLEGICNEYSVRAEVK